MSWWGQRRARDNKSHTLNLSHLHSLLDEGSSHATATFFGRGDDKFSQIPMLLNSLWPFRPVTITDPWLMDPSIKYISIKVKLK